MLELYAHPQSPPCRMVTMLLDVLNVDYEYKFVDLLSGEQNKPDFLKMNPQHNVPFIVDGKTSMNESAAILVYLAEKYGKGKNHLYPADNVEARARINQRLCFVSSTVFERFREAFFPLVFKGAKTVDGEAKKKLVEMFDWMDGYIVKTGFVADTEKPTIADLAMYAWVSAFACLGKHLIDVEGAYPKLVAWGERVKAELSNADKSSDEGLRVLAKFFRDRSGLDI